MRRDPERKRIFTRRSFIVGGAQAGLVSLVGYRLFDLQVLQSHKFKTMSDKNRISFRVLTPRRGLIADCFGLVLAKNKKSFQLNITREHAPNPEASLLKLKNFIPLNDTEIEDILDRMRVRPAFVPVLVKDHLIASEAFNIEEASFDLPGITVEQSYNRFYPYNEIGAQILGYVGSVDKKTLETDSDVLLEQPGFRIGKDGAERAYEKTLRGRAGNKRVEVNVSGRIVDILESNPAHQGFNVVLTIDWALQEFVHEQLAGLSAAAVIMDIHTGKIMASVSTPSYNPNKFARGIKHNEWAALNESKMAPMQNKSLRGAWSPGSTFKIIVALAALEEGIVSPKDTYFCRGYLEWGNNYKKYCWSRAGHGNVNLDESLSESCDVYYYEVSQKLGIDKISKYAKVFGFGQRPIPNFPGQFKGILPTRRWLKQRYDQDWRIGDTINISIGQGYLVTTPLQNALSFARLTNGGYAVVPRIIRDDVHPWGVWPYKDKVFPKINVKLENLNHVLKGLYNAVNSPKGTARKSSLNMDNWKMIGKTGTVQTRRITVEERARGITKDEDRIWDFRDHANFVGVAPYHAPRWVVSVFVEHGGGGSAVAAPIAKEIMLKVKEREALWDNIPYFNSSGVGE